MARTQLLEILTPRVQEIFNIIPAGESTFSIAKFFNLIKESAKNKLKICKKVGNNSE